MDLKGVEQISLSAEWTEYLNTICIPTGAEDVEDSTSGTKSDPRNRYFVGHKDAYRAAIALAINKGLSPDPTLAGSRKSKWQTPTIFDEQMHALLKIARVSPPLGVHIHHHVMGLAEAGLSYMKSITDNHEDLWEHLYKA